MAAVVLLTTTELSSRALEVEPREGPVEQDAGHLACRRSHLVVAERFGDLAKPVEQVVMAYGSSSSTTSYYRFWKHGADAVISGEQSEWSTVRPAIDMGMGVIELGHSNSEAFGMEGMARLLRENFPGLRVEHVPTGDSFQYL